LAPPNIIITKRFFLIFVDLWFKILAVLGARNEMKNKQKKKINQNSTSKYYPFRQRRQKKQHTEKKKAKNLKIIDKKDRLCKS
jgi:hypothetical protein